MGMHCIVQMQCVPIFYYGKIRFKKEAPHMNEKKLSRPLISLIVSIALIIVGIAGSFILQTNSGKTTIRNVTIESESGHTLAMDVYIPENATAETPAPAIFVQHGGNNNKEEMQHYCIAPAAAMLRSAWICTAWAKANLCRTPNGSPRAAVFMMRYATA